MKRKVYLSFPRNLIHEPLIYQVGHKFHVVTNIRSASMTKDLGLVGVANRPGLAGSLLVGLCFAKAFSFASGIPLLGVDHVRSHIFANFLEEKPPRFPFVALVASGGHTSLFYFKDFSYK